MEAADSLPEGSPSRDRRVGETFAGKYRIVRRLGRGGMGLVYEAEHLLMKRRVALKVLHPQYAQDPRTAARFRQEAIAASTIGHPNIVEVTDMDRAEDGTLYLVMELLEGQDLERALAAAGGRLPFARARRVVIQIAEAVGAAHRRGILHRDLKPANVFLTERDGTPDFVKVLDFGVSKFVDGLTEGAATETGTAIGTPLYMPLEQLTDAKSVDERADLYAIGVILFRALTGRYPVAGSTPTEVIANALSGERASLASLRPDLPAPLHALSDRLLARAREDRPESCAALVDALEAIEVEEAASLALADTLDARVEAPPAVTPARGGRAGPVALVVGALALLGGAGAWIATSGETDETPPPAAATPGPAPPPSARVEAPTPPALPTGVDPEVDGPPEEVRAPVAPPSRPPTSDPSPEHGPPERGPREEAASPTQTATPEPPAPATPDFDDQDHRAGMAL